MELSSDIKRRFVGAWRLVSFEEVTPEGEVNFPYGPDALGLLIYSSSGYMSVHIMRRDRLRANLTSLSLEEIKSAIEEFTGFYGSYEIDETNQVVIHRVEGHVRPESIGKVLRREFSFEGDRLILKPAPNRRLTWESLATNEP